MIGAKVDCRYFRSRVILVCGRWAWRLGRSRAVRSCGLTSIADPGSSSSVVGWESRPSKGQGFPGNASSTRSQPVLSITPKELCESGNRLIFRCLGDFVHASAYSVQLSSRSGEQGCRLV